MVNQKGGESPHPNKRSRSNLATVADVGFVLIGLALIVSAFSNLPGQASGPVNVRLSRPWFRSCSKPSALLCCCPAWLGCSILRVTLRQPGLMEAKARTLITPETGGKHRRSTAAQSPLRGRERELKDLAQRR